MKRIGWARLMRLGMVGLKLRPDEFWRLTPAELALMAGHGGGAAALSRKGLADLLARYPDCNGADLANPHPPVPGNLATCGEGKRH